MARPGKPLTRHAKARALRSGELYGSENLSTISVAKLGEACLLETLV